MTGPPLQNLFRILMNVPSRLMAVIITVQTLLGPICAVVKMVTDWPPMDILVKVYAHTINLQSACLYIYSILLAQIWLQLDY